MAQMLLNRIAPASAMAFLATEPRALEALQQFLSGNDRDSLMAKTVRQADALSAQKALQNGSKARFATAKAVPLFDLLMQAMGAMLRTGTSLPLNRSGAAGWVHDGAIWFVAKRLADATRDWINKNEPDQTVPGETKNDRLFDTWQDYAVIERNLHTGQAVWYVTVHGQAAEGSEQGAYTHSLTMLKFPLSKVFADPGQYPAEMLGHIEVLESRAAAGAEAQESESGVQHVPQHEKQQQEALQQETKSAAIVAPGAPKATKPVKEPVKTLKEPVFNKPKAVATPKSNAQETVAKKAAITKTAKPSPSDASLLDQDTNAFEAAAAQSLSRQAATTAKSAAKPSAPPEAPSQHAARNAPLPLKLPKLRPLKPMQPLANKANLKANLVLDQLPPITARTSVLDGESQYETEPMQQASHAVKEPQPVVLKPNLPALPGQADKPAAEPTQLALDFIEWLQQSLVDRDLKYNETGAAVHFVPQGMALVSPLIFKQYAGTLTTEAFKIPELGMQVQKAVIRADWHMPGPNKSNIVKYAVKRGDCVVSHLSVVLLLLEPGRFVQPVPPSNPVLELV